MRPFTVALVILVALGASARAPAGSGQPPQAPDLGWDALAAAPTWTGARVAPLDVHAEAMLRDITGRRTLPSPSSPSGPHPPPAASLLDLCWNAPAYRETPVVRIDYRPLLQRLLDAADAPPDLRRRCLEARRVPIDLADRALARALARPPLDPRAFDEAQRVVERIGLARAAAERLLTTPYPDGAGWRPAADDPDLAPELRRLQADWRSPGPDGVSVAALAQRLTTHARAALPPDAERRLRLETFTRDIRPMPIAAAFYAVGVLAMLIGPRARTGAVGVGAVVLGGAVHLAGLAARGLIAQRLPITNQYESMLTLAWLIVAAGAGAAVLRNQRSLLAIAAGSSAGLIGLAGLSGVPGADIAPEPGVLATAALLRYHVAAVLLAYAVMTIAFGAAVAALVARARPRSAPGRPRRLAELDRIVEALMRLAFWTLGLGVVLGAWWADRAWGRWWAFDPKETWALITWLIYLAGVHVRAAHPRRAGAWRAWLGVLGFLAMLWTYFGVNLLTPGLHAYAS